MIRPGPPSIAPDSCPGGVVIHIYGLRPDVEGPVLLLVSRVGLDGVEAMAEADALAAERLAGGGPLILVGYDGDTGRRYTPDAWHGRPPEGGGFLG